MVKLDQGRADKNGAIKCILTVWHGGELVNTGMVNLSSIQSRNMFLQKVREDLSAEADKLLLKVSLRTTEELKLIAGSSEAEPTELSEEQLVIARQAIASGKHISILESAWDVLFAGDPCRRRYVYLGFLSSARRNKKVHVFLIGGSQQGKSYLITQVAKLFPGKVLYLDSASAKAFYYRAKKYGPTYFEGKIIIVDELLDNESIWSTAKAFTSMNKDSAIHETVIDGELLQMFVDGLPQVTSSAVSVPTGEKGDQVTNRFHVLNIDESEEQSVRAHGAIVEGRTLGNREDRGRATLEQATAISSLLTEIAATCKVVVPYARWIKVEADRRNEFPKFLDLIEMNAILHSGERSVLPSGEIVANFRDYEEAAQLWAANERYHTHVPEKVLRLLDLMVPNRPYTVEELVELTVSAEGQAKGFRKQLSDGSVLNYLSQLRTEELVTSVRNEATKGMEYKSIRAAPVLNFLTDLNQAYLTNSLALELPSEKALADELKTIFEARLTILREMGHVTPLDYTGLACELLDTSALRAVKKLRIDEFKPTGTSENVLNSSKLSIVKELSGEAGEQNPADQGQGHWSSINQLYTKLQQLKAIVEQAEKSGYSETWIEERCEENGITDVAEKIDFLRRSNL